MALLMAGKEWGDPIPAEVMEEADDMQVFGPGEEGGSEADLAKDAGDAPAAEGDKA
jgi:hypothetical protein